MKKNFLNRLIVILLALTLAAVLVGCSNGETESGGNTASTAPSAGTTNTPAKETASATPSASPENTADATESATPDAPTAAPETPEATKEPPAPVATVEPGKETYAGSILDPNTGVDYNVVADDGTDGQRSAGKYAMQFFATTTIDSITKSYGSTSGILRLELYHWMGTYEATLESEPVAADEFEVVSDGNSNTKVVFGFDEQLDGEYLLVATPGSDSYSDVIYFWAKVGATQFHTRAYIDDTEDDMAISNIIHYTKTPENLWGPLMDSGL